jgi:hypothetical protein
MKFAELNEHRWKTEAPHIPPMPNRRSLPLAERDLSSVDRAILDWLRNATEPVSAVEAALTVRCTESTARSSLTRLTNNGVAEVVGVVEGKKLFAASEPPSEDKSVVPAG